MVSCADTCKQAAMLVSWGPVVRETPWYIKGLTAQTQPKILQMAQFTFRSCKSAMLVSWVLWCRRLHGKQKGPAETQSMYVQITAHSYLSYLWKLWRKSRSQIHSHPRFILVCHVLFALANYRISCQVSFGGFPGTKGPQSSLHFFSSLFLPWESRSCQGKKRYANRLPKIKVSAICSLFGQFLFPRAKTLLRCYVSFQGPVQHETPCQTTGPTVQTQTTKCSNATCFPLLEVIEETRRLCKQVPDVFGVLFENWTMSETKTILPCFVRGLVLWGSMVGLNTGRCLVSKILRVKKQT